MRSFITLLLFVLISFSINAQSLIGAWENYLTSEDNEELKNVVIFTDGYYSSTTFNAKTGEFIKTHGGAWELNGNILTQHLEFNSTNSFSVGNQENHKILITETEVKFPLNNQRLKRIDKGEPGKLQGAWLMSGRVKDGKTELRDSDGPRKTMKILSGTRFQWIAYNTETKQFMGTGGGTYTTLDDNYTENIEFFSKDNTKVGLNLKFNYKLKNGDWNHSGFSSKGDPINEIWSLRE